MRELMAGLPSDGADYLVKVGLVVWLVAELENTLFVDLMRLRDCMPPELDLKTIEGMKITGKTVQKLGEYFIEHAPKITDAEVADYYRVGGEILTEVAPERNAMLHSRIGGHRDDGKLVLVRMRVSDQISDELALISSGWLDEMIERMDERRRRLETVRPPLEMKA